MAYARSRPYTCGSSTMGLRKATLMTMFAVSLAIANITAAKLAFFIIPVIGGVAVPAVFFAVGVAFLCTDLISELCGKGIARTVVNGSAVAYGPIYGAIWMPIAPFYPVYDACVTTLGASANMFLRRL